MKNNKLLKNTFLDLFLKIILWSLFLPALITLIISILKRFNYQWLYDINPNIYVSFKSFVYGFFDSFNGLIILVIIWLIGILLIIYFLVKKYNNFIYSLTSQAEKLLSDESLYIELPKELEVFQKELNHLKEENLKNKRKAQENEQRKNDLIVYLAHDLKTPLTSTIGYLSLIDEVKDMPQKQREKYVKIALDKAYHLENLINELFDIARFNSETIILDKQKLDINMMLSQLKEDFYPLLKENEKELKLDINGSLEYYGDSEKLARVFSNLIRNAIYYSTSKEIDVKTIKNKDEIIITFTNEGEISEEKIKKIFEKFYRADMSRTTKTGGSGLGLAISKEIIELHKGNITAISKDNKTTFTIKLPIL